MAVLLAATASCSSGDADPLPSGDPASTTITWYASTIDRNQNDYRQILINEFRIAHPSIKVNLVSQQPQTDLDRQELIEAIHSDHGPDVYLGDVIWPAEFAEAKLARPLDDAFAPDFWERFPPELLSAMKYRGKIYAAPFFASQGVLYYRADLMAAPPRTWEQLVETSATLLRDKKVAHGFVWQGDAYEGLTCNWVEFLADAGGSTLDKSGTKSQINSPQARRALQFLRDLIDDGITPAQVTSFTEQESSQLFVSGQAAFFRGWNTALTRMNTPSSMIYNKIGVAPLPTFADQPGPGHSTIGGWSLYVNPNTRKFEAVKTFVDWMTGLEAQTIMARFSQIPANTQARNDPTSRQNQAIAVGLNVRAVARPSQTAAYPAISRVVYSAINDALDGEPSVDAALRNADSKLEAELR
jgi:multiple sugar transport system substrate-binding protein